MNCTKFFRTSDLAAKAEGIFIESSASKNAGRGGKTLDIDNVADGRFRLCPSPSHHHI